MTGPLKRFSEIRATALFGYGSPACVLNRKGTQSKLAELGWVDEQGGKEFVQEVSLGAARAASEAARWLEYVAAQVQGLLPRKGRLQRARESARAKLLARRQLAVDRILSGKWKLVVNLMTRGEILDGSSCA